MTAAWRGRERQPMSRRSVLQETKGNQNRHRPSGDITATVDLPKSCTRWRAAGARTKIFLITNRMNKFPRIY